MPTIMLSVLAEVAILAGGCFWGMEDVLRDAPGIVDIEVGYAGGASNHATYEEVSSGRTGHAEAVRVTFDPSSCRTRTCSRSGTSAATIRRS